jgi:CHASE1-domain containing sensor protein
MKLASDVLQSRCQAFLSHEKTVAREPRRMPCRRGGVLRPGRLALLLPRKVWRRRGVAVGAPLIVALAITVGLFVWVSALEETRIEARFDKQAEEITGAVQANFEAAILHVHALGNLYLAAPGAENPRTFATFATETLRLARGVQALSWNPRVTQRERERFERRARQMGYDGFRILERDGGGRLVPAAERDQYVAVLHIEPDALNREARGFDVASEPLRRDALVRACETARPAATGRIRLVQERTDQPGVLIFLPIYDGGRAPDDPRRRCAAIRGFVTGVFRLGDLVGRRCRPTRIPTSTCSSSTNRVPRETKGCGPASALAARFLAIRPPRLRAC